MRSLFPAALVLISGCAYISDKDEEARLDPDEDGVLVGEDCDDTDSESVAPVNWYRDDDGDGYGNSDDRRKRCEQPDGFVELSGDCDDLNPEVHPDHEEICDGLDNDCDDALDEGLDLSSWYRDADGDGFGDSEESQEACAAPSGFVDNPDDCDDTSVFFQDGGSAEIPYNGIDDNCDASDGDGDWDKDGYWSIDYLDIMAEAGLTPMSIPAGFDNDCNDEDGTIHPDAAETPYDGIDSDCRGDSDCDIDGDGFEALSGICLPTVADCNDADPDVHPDATETCLTSVDDDCNGSADGLDLEGCITFYRDVDGDSWGTSTPTVCRCLLPDFFAERDGDCEDANPDIHPEAVDIPYDGEDTDCSGDGDCDADGDGFDALAGTCSPEVIDCDDADAAVFPGAAETCETEFDDDCDGETNEEDALACSTFFFDFDEDGFGADDKEICMCEPETLYLEIGGDCADEDDSIFPGATEACDAVDSDCNGSAVDGFTDFDGDGAPDCIDPPDLGIAHGATWRFDGSLGTNTGISVAAAGNQLVFGAPEPGEDPAFRSRAYLMLTPPMGIHDLEAGARVIEHSGATRLGSSVVGVVDPTGTEDWIVLGMRGFSGLALVPSYLETVSLDEAPEASIQVVSAAADWDCGADLRAGFALLGGQESVLVGCPRAGTGDILVGVEHMFILGEEWAMEFMGDQIGAGIDEADPVTDRGIGIGDVDGDGMDDVLIAAPKADQKADNAGVMALYLGPVTDSRSFSGAHGVVYGDGKDALLGGAIDVGQDWTGDGINDIIVLAGAGPFDPATIGNGAAHIITGASILSDTTDDFRAGDGFATLVDNEDHRWNVPRLVSLGGAGPEDAPRMVIGLPEDDAGGAGAGLLYAIRGPIAAGTTDITEVAEIVIGSENEGLGSALHVADLDDDGHNEVLVGAVGVDSVYGFMSIVLFESDL